MSLAIYVAFDGPLDQYYMRDPHRLFSAAIETPQVDPQNAVLLEQHVTCAAAELPLVPAIDVQFFGEVRLRGEFYLQRRPVLSPFCLFHAT